jgi:hypothetical protein
MGGALWTLSWIRWLLGVSTSFRWSRLRSSSSQGARLGFNWCRDRSFCFGAKSERFVWSEGEDSGEWVVGAKA